MPFILYFSLFCFQIHPVSLQKVTVTSNNISVDSNPSDESSSLLNMEERKTTNLQSDSGYWVCNKD